MTERETSSKRPYLLRAMHEWMNDNGLTPHIVVDVTQAGVQVPHQHVQDGKIILNVSYDATQDLQLDNHQLTFSARFGGVAHHVIVPADAVLGIYARESGQGMVFTGDEQSTPANDRDGGGGDDEPPGRGHLKVIK
jgi:stringent starvation protein B